MKRFRTVLFWLHLLSGVTAGTVILIMSATGVILALKPQIQNWIDRDVRYVTPQTTRLGAQALLTAVKAVKPESSPQSLTVARDPGLAATVSLGREGTLYVNPYTGALLGSGSIATTQFFQSITNWHRYLATTGESRTTGRALTGASNLAFVVLALTGLVIWWPKQFSRQALKPIVWFRRTSTGRARDFNWHNTIGFLCLIPIVIMASSGVVMSYSWANDLVYRLTGSPVPVRVVARASLPPAGEGASGREGGARQERAARRLPGGTQGAATPIDLDRAWARAEAQVPTWSILSMRLPAREGAPVAITITDGATWNEFARSNLIVNSTSGDIEQWQPYGNNSLGQKVRGWLRFAHTGELGGLPGQLVAGLGCLGGVVLVYTGWSLACRRLWKRTRRSRLGVSAPAMSALGSNPLVSSSVREPLFDSSELQR